MRRTCLTRLLLLCLALSCLLEVAVAEELLLSPDDRFVKNKVQNSPNGTVVVLQPGIYTRLCGVSISTDLHFRSLAGATHTTLSCGLRSQHFAIGSANVVFEGITFTNGRAFNGGCLQVAYGATVRIDHCAFFECHASWFGGGGGTMAVTNSSGVHISNTVINGTSATAGGAVAVVHDSAFVAEGNVSFSNGFAVEYGGLAYVLASSIELANNVRIERFWSDSDGGMVALDLSTMVVRDRVSIADVGAHKTGGVFSVWVSHVELMDDVQMVGALAEAWGGCAYLEVGSSMVAHRNVLFSDCWVYESAAGVFLDEDCSFSAEDNVTFTHCDSDLEGGVFYLDRAHLELRRDILIANSSATDGGGAITLYSSTVVMHNHVSIQDCWSTGPGGSVYAEDSDVFLLDDVAVLRSWGGQAGGSFSLESGSVLVASGGLTVHDSSSGAVGGVMYVGEASSADVDSADFARSYAEEWGGVAYAYYGSMRLTNATVVKSESMLPGGVLFVEASPVHMQDVAVSACRARGSGGFIAFWEFGDVTLENVSVTSCRAVSFGGGRTLEPYEAGSGGGIYLDWRSTLAASRLSVTDCHADSDGGFVYVVNAAALQLSAVQVDNCTAGRDGGAVMVYDSRLTCSEAVSVRGCSAGRWGGMAAMVGGRAELERVEVEGCRAGKDGGGVHARGPGRLTVRNCSLGGNMAAAGGGGGIYSTGESLAIADSVLEDNTALHGGGVAVAAGSVTVEGCSIRNNVAGRHGGGLYMAGDTVLEVRDTAIVGCQAEAQGGGVWVGEMASATAQGQVTVAGNQAGAGGGLRLEGGGFELLGGTLEVLDNAASGEGGGVSAATAVKLSHGHSVLRSNHAAESGGGYMGEGAAARLELGVHHVLRIQACTARVDGGGMALRDGASMRVAINQTCPSDCHQNPTCQPECMTLECNWDGGHCSERFEQAGEDAALACDRSRCPLQAQLSTERCEEQCLRASCDWSEANAPCRHALDALGACPLFDALTHAALVRQPRVRFVQGGSTGGFGRCVNASCERGVCVTVDDAGRVLRLVGDEVVDAGEANGTCADKPRLPSSGFAYHAANMSAVLELSVDALLSQHPGCGARPLVIEGNTATRNGGGVFHASCEADQQRCFLGGLSPAHPMAASIVLEQNQAGQGGGAVFSQCGEIAACAALTSLALGLPLPDAAASRRAAMPEPLLAARDNAAAGYGDDLASAPTQIEADALDAAFMPGTDTLRMTIALRDARQQAVRAGAAALSYVLEVRVQAGSTWSDSEPDLSIQLEALPLDTSNLAHRMPPCVLGQQRVNLSLALSGGAVQQGQGPLQTVEVGCVPCGAGHKRLHEGGRWSCRRCLDTEYLVDSSNPDHQCRPCPVGLHCTAESVQLVLEGSVWRTEGDVYVLDHCPQGYSVEPAPGADFDAAAQRCEPCGAGQECAEERCTACALCRPGYSKSEGGAGLCQVCGVDTFAAAHGAVECQRCAEKRTTRNQTARASEEACVCDDDHYSVNLTSPFECVRCPTGARCSDGRCMLRSMEEAVVACSDGRTLVGSWLWDNSTMRWRLTACPEGFDVVAPSEEEQACEEAPVTSVKLSLKSGLSRWAVVGVVMGSLVGIALLAGWAVWWIRLEWRRSRDALAELRMERQGIMAASLVMESTTSTEHIDRAREGDERAVAMLHELFPTHVAEALMRGQRTSEDRSERCAVFFSDIVGFTALVAQLEAAQVSAMLDRLFDKFDRLAAQHGVYKIETIGDCYIGVTNLVQQQKPQDADQVARIAAFSIDAIAAAHSTLVDPDDPSKGTIEIRAGFDVGPVVGHVQGHKQKKYTIFGNTVNTASRMESTGEPGRIQCTKAAADMLQEQDPSLHLVSRGEVRVKGRGVMKTFFVEGRLSADLCTPTGPPPDTAASANKPAKTPPATPPSGSGADDAQAAPLVPTDPTPSAPLLPASLDAFGIDSDPHAAPESVSPTTSAPDGAAE